MTILLFIAVLVILVLVHEFGHFIAAKLFGMKVEEFGIGFPPRITSFKKGDTRYSLNLLPLGGFVRIFGEEGEGASNSRSYASRPAWQKSVVLLSGVFMNFLLTVLIFWVTFTIGFPTALGEKESGRVSERALQVIGITKDSPAKEVQMKRGDTILGISSEPSPRVKVGESGIRDIHTVEELQKFTNEHKGEVLILTIKRGKEILEKEIFARQNPPKGEGAMGLILAQTGLVSFPWWEALGKAIDLAIRNFWFILSGIYLLFERLLSTGQVVGDIAGPVGIAVMVGDFYALGIHYFLAFVGLISVNLAVLNILPIPALDGGRLFFIGVEKIKGSPLKPETESKIHAFGFALLLSLVLLVTIRDILQL